MGRFTRERCYQIELDKAYAEGFSGAEAERIANERAEDMYWSLVDEGRRRAKDRDI